MARAVSRSHIAQCRQTVYFQGFDCGQRRVASPRNMPRIGPIIALEYARTSLLSRLPHEDTNRGSSVEENSPDIPTISGAAISPFVVALKKLQLSGVLISISNLDTIFMFCRSGVARCGLHYPGTWHCRHFFDAKSMSIAGYPGNDVLVSESNV